MQPVPHPTGGFQFVVGNNAYAESVQALSGFSMVRATFRQQLPYRQGFEAAAQHLAGLGQTVRALCAIELRIPQPFSFEAFAAFNIEYAALLTDFDLVTEVQGTTRSLLARTNVAPVHPALNEPTLQAFCYTMPITCTSPQFVISGCGDLRDGPNSSVSIVRHGENSAEAQAEKASFVVAELESALVKQQLEWADASHVTVYVPQALEHACTNVLTPRIPALQQLGIHWLPSYPPIAGMEFEMDVRGVTQEIQI